MPFPGDTTAVIQTSYAGGELAPSLFARVDLEKYHSGMALGLNFYVDYRGGASTRPGSQYIGTSLAAYPSPPRLIDFIYSTIATYVLEFGDHYVRFISNGAFIIDGGTGLPLVVVSPYAVGDLPLLKYAQSANVLTLTHPSYPPYNLTRTSPVTFTLTKNVIGPAISAPPPPIVTPVNGANTNFYYGYVVTAVSSIGEESTASYPVFCLTSILNQATGTVNSVAFTAVADAAYYKVYKVGPTPSGGGGLTRSPLSTVYGFIGSTDSTFFVDNNIAPDFSQTPPQFQDPFSPGQVAQVRVGAPGAGYADGLCNLVFTGDGVGANGYAYTLGGKVIGVVLINPGHGYTVCTVSDDGANSAAYVVTLGQETGTYPACVGYFQQRRLFGGTVNFPESFVASQPGNYNDFNTNPFALASDAITASIASRQVNAIKSFTAMPTGLVILTTGGGFLVSGGGQNAPITPNNIVAFPQASSGCNDLPPLVINYDILYAQNRGAVVRDLAFNFYVQSYTGTDRSVLASHLFSNFALKEWAYAEEPFRLVHVVRDDGVLLNFTYVPEQEIFAWTHWETQGYYRSVASVPEGSTNAVYVVVQRYVGGVWKYFIERMASGLFATLEDSWCLDCALATPNVTPAANILLSALTGNITVAASANVFALGDVGKTLWGANGFATITAYTSPTLVSASVVKAFDPAIESAPYPIAQGSWYLNPNVTTLGGLTHLEGQTVSVVADGLVVTGLVVAGGSVTLPNPASIVVVGLPYVCQFQTLKLDLGEPTIQGKRKQIAAVTVRAHNALGLEIGPDFGHLVVMKELLSPYPPSLLSLDARTIIRSVWSKEGQICLQQSNPLPATILGIIPEVQVGDS